MLRCYFYTYGQPVLLVRTITPAAGRDPAAVPLSSAVLHLPSFGGASPALKPRPQPGPPPNAAAAPAPGRRAGARRRFPWRTAAPGGRRTARLSPRSPPERRPAPLPARGGSRPLCRGGERGAAPVGSGPVRR